MSKKIKFLLVLLLTLTALIFPISAESIQDYNKQKSSVESRIEKVNKAKREELQKKAQLESQKKNISSQQAAESKEYNELIDEIDQAMAAIEDIDKSIKEAEDNYNRQNELLKARLKVMYESFDISILNLLIKSRNIVELYENVQYISLVLKNDKKTLEEFKLAKSEVEFKKGTFTEEKAKLLALANEKKSRLATLKSSRAGVERDLQKSATQLEKLEVAEDLLLEEANKLNSIIKSLSKTGRKYTGGPMTWPVPNNYNVSSLFGMRKHPILKKYKLHTGIDITAKSGTPMVAANDGTVIMSGWQNGYGNTVVIDHGGGITTLYAHASKLLVERGDKVKAGDMIAKMGSTGSATGPNLHFEVRKDGKPVNPLNGYLKQ